MIKQPAVNRVVYDAIPLNKVFKRYWLRKFSRMVENSGRREAERKFKHLKEVILLYLSDYTRHEAIEKYYKMAGFRKNSYLKMVFVYADCQPHFCLDFLKLYSYSPREKNIPQWGTPNSPHTLARETWKRLEDTTNVDTRMPLALEDWIYVVSLPSRKREELYDKLKNLPGERLFNTIFGTSDYSRIKGESFARFCRLHSKSEWSQYWTRRIYTIQKAWTTETRGIQVDKGMVPEVYKDYLESSESSKSFDLDYDNLSHMCERIAMHNGTSPLSESQLRFILSYLSDELRENLVYLMEHGKSGWTCLIPELQGPRGGNCKYPWDGNTGSYVGHVHHIPKKGAGCDYRDIAVPNRLIQEALMPCWLRLRLFQEFIPQDASLDQAKFDTKIQNRVNNPNLYIGSVDLSKATDNLPRDWAFAFIEMCASKWGWKTPEEEESYQLFKTVASSYWEDQGYMIKWPVGQPLGSLPSFATLTIEHWILCESLALSEGMGHSPFSIVGDDLVTFNKKFRGRYIATLTSRNIPLSLHKSFEGRLTEFAGKTYVANCVPFFTTDHAVITWNSLFDYQIATGVLIPWKSMPRKLRKKWCKVAKQYDPTGYSRETGESTYSFAQAMLVPQRGSSKSVKPIDDAKVEAFEYYVYTTPTAKAAREPGKSYYHGMINLCGHPVVLLDSRFADKDGWFERFRPVQLPKWYLDKYRATPTDIACKASCFAVSDHKDSLDDNTYFEPYGKNW